MQICAVRNGPPYGVRALLVTPVPKKEATSKERRARVDGAMRGPLTSRERGRLRPRLPLIFSSR